MKKFNIELLFVLATCLVLPCIMGLEYGREFFYLSFCILTSLLVILTCEGDKYKIMFFTYFFVFLFITLSFFYISNLPVLVGPDEERFYTGLLSYRNNYDFYMANSIAHIKDSYIVLSSSYPIFGMLLNPIMDMYAISGPEIAIPINFIMLLVSVVIFKNILLGRVKSNYWLFIILCLPSFTYHSSIFAKDILSNFIVFLSLYYLFNRSFLLFIITLILSIALRPYSFVVVAIYFIFIRKEMKYMILCSVFSLLLVFLFSGLTGLVNTVFTTLYLIVSPNPLGSEYRVDYLPLYFESIAFFLFYITSVYLNFKSKNFNLLIIFHLALISYASIMAVMAFYGSISYGFEYQMGQMGGNVVRKKLPIVPLVILYFYLSIHGKNNKFKTVNQEAT
ncbi:hypothetical protein [Pseudoalteromonas sp. SCQQ13]|uniref:hypothetical protein n=1 Tax=Pseudoalteromonas sp. SCQQ13 TaxID=2792066 RepID=UPI0018CF6001|nr:hypothetical protein [Pseudoalteromonas sp. SCQQ13]MBH0093519.1 hypothetical protein [Pseudoalteromonas sp. SCQQ13]